MLAEENGCRKIEEFAGRVVKQRKNGIRGISRLRIDSGGGENAMNSNFD